MDQQLFCWRHFSNIEVVQNTDLNILALYLDKSTTSKSNLSMIYLEFDESHSLFLRPREWTFRSRTFFISYKDKREMCNLTIYSLKVRMPWKCIHQHINAMMSGRGRAQWGQTFYRFKLYYISDFSLFN